MTKPIVALVVDKYGNHFVRLSSDVTMVWVHEDHPDDRVFEVRRREPANEFLAYLGDRSTWGHSEDDRQKALEVTLLKAGYTVRSTAN